MKTMRIPRPSEIILGDSPKDSANAMLVGVAMACRHALLRGVSRNTRRAYRNEFDHLVSTICCESHRPLEYVLANLPKMIGPTHALAYRELLLVSTTLDGDPLSVSTVRRKLAFASRLFREFKHAGFTKVNPFARLTYVAQGKDRPAD
ncbi:MAG: hypothetical protein KAV00_09340 [Phycisphaerae bacterium]|nr:hypothetical protein [Phycisphaerae bacterium]